MKAPSAPLLAALAAAGALAAASPALAASTVYGAGPAQLCYRAALGGNPDLTAIANCDTALYGSDLDAADRAATMVNRGVLRLKRREADLALADFDRVIAWRPTLGEAHVNRGAALILKGDFDGAIAAIDRGLELGADEPHEAYFNRAVAQESKGDLTAAYRDYRRASTLKPDWEAPGRELARFTVTSAD
ncbi:MAG: tetratricopeptide repeat protein [Hyphomonadaceae bacterium]|nr:tetratricopeptide repeat protein [Hyphomonadaceae bacterium]